MLTKKGDKLDKRNTKKFLIIGVVVIALIALIIIFYIFNNYKKEGSLIFFDSDKEQQNVLYSNTQSAITLEIENFNFVKIKEGHGKLSNITISVTNKGVSDINPSLYILVYDEVAGGKYTSRKTVPISGVINASTGKISHLTIPLDLDVWGIENNKNVKVALYRGQSPVVSINFKANFLEGTRSQNVNGEGVLETLKSYFIK